MGHGGGEAYYTEKDLALIKNINSIVMLIGCSSSKQIREQKNGNEMEELHSISLEYLLSKWLIFLFFAVYN